MKAVDPTIHAGIPVENYVNWDPVVMASPGGASFDYLVYHYYPQTTATISDALTLQAPYLIGLQQPNGITASLNNLEFELLQYGGGRCSSFTNCKATYPIAVSEWNIISGNSQQNSSIVGGMFTAEMIGEMANWGVQRAQIFDFSQSGPVPTPTPTSGAYGYQFPCGSWGLTTLFAIPGVLPNPTCTTAQSGGVTVPAGTIYPPGRAFQMASQSGFVTEGAQALAVDQPNANVHIYSSQNGDQISFMLINTNQTTAQTISLSADGITAGSKWTSLQYTKALYDNTQNNGTWYGLTSGSGGIWTFPFSVTLPAWSMTTYTFYGTGTPSTLCVGGQLYTLADNDNFANDSTIAQSDLWPPPTGTEWSNQYSFGRTNNAGSDLALYPSQHQMAALWPSSPPVLALVPGVGLAVNAYPVPTPTSSAQMTALCNNDNGGDTTCRKYLAGLLSNNQSHVTGYWEYTAQLPPNNAAGQSWWPAVWTLNETGTGNYTEYDNEEQWPAAVLGANVVQQTEQCVSPCSGSAHYQRTTLATSQTAMHSYGVYVSNSFAGFYIDRSPTTYQYPINATGAIDPIIQLQVNGAYGVTPGPTASAQMLVQDYVYYSPSPLSACSGGIATPAPSPTPSPTPSASPTPNPLVSAVFAAATPALFWQMQEPIGPTAAYDASGNGYTGQIGTLVQVGQTGIQSAFSNYSELFPAHSSGSSTVDGTGYYTTLNNFEPTNAFTAVIWLEFPSNPAYANETLLCYGNLLYGGGPAFAITFNTANSGVITAKLNTGTTPTTNILTSSAALSTGTPHMVAITLGSGTYSLWVDPTTTTPNASGSVSGNVFLSTISSGFSVGMDTLSEAASFGGNINYVVLYPYTLTPAQLENLYSYH